MKIGVDSSILVAGVHANHPLHAVAANWLIRNIASNELIVAHHSILETYAVLTRLPGKLRTSGSEAKQLLESTVKSNMHVADFSSVSIWDCIDSIVSHSAVGGHSYDAFIIEILNNAEVEAIATFNTTHFIELTPDLPIIDPAKPSIRISRKINIVFKLMPYLAAFYLGPTPVYPSFQSASLTGFCRQVFLLVSGI